MIVVDLAKRFGKSASGKTTIIAIRAFEAAVCRAVGLDPNHVRHLRLTLEPGSVPIIEAELIITSSEMSAISHALGGGEWEDCRPQHAPPRLVRRDSPQSESRQLWLARWSQERSEAFAASEVLRGKD